MLITAADRFITRSVESEGDQEGPPRLHLKTAPTVLKKMGRVDSPTISTESALSVTSRRRSYLVAIGG
jgi:hypothetical protein